MANTELMTITQAELTEVLKASMPDGQAESMSETTFLLVALKRVAEAANLDAFVQSFSQPPSQETAP